MLPLCIECRFFYSREYKRTVFSFACFSWILDCFVAKLLAMTENGTAALFWLLEFVWVMSRTLFVRASLRYCLCSLHHERTAVGTYSSRRLCVDGKLALWIFRTTIERAETPFPLHERSLFAFRTGDARVCGAFCFFALFSFFNMFTLW